MTDHRIAEIIEIVSAVSRVPPEKISPETRILDEGLIDSLNVFHIIAEIESRFGITLGVMDANIQDFSTPNAIGNLIDRLAN